MDNWGFPGHDAIISSPPTPTSLRNPSGQPGPGRPATHLPWQRRSRNQHPAKFTSRLPWPPPPPSEIAQTRQQAVTRREVRDLANPDTAPPDLPKLGKHYKGERPRHTHTYTPDRAEINNNPIMAVSTPSSRAYFEQQREALMGEIAMVTKTSIDHPTCSPC